MKALLNTAALALFLSQSAVFLSAPSVMAAELEGRQSTAFSQSLAIAAAQDEAVSLWYQSTSYQPVWTSPSDAPRRAALLAALDTASDHGLPLARYDVAGLRDALTSARSEGDLGRIEVRMSRAYLDFARDLTSGMLDPKKIDSTIVREITHRDPQALMAAIASSNPEAALADLLPRSEAYAALAKAKIELEAVIANGAWGPKLEARSYEPGQTGAHILALRDRLVTMGYLSPTASGSYDGAMQTAVREFQALHGLPADGVIGAATLAELNIGPEARLKSVLVAMERERWMSIDRSGRMIWVNLPDFSAAIVDDGQVVFKTRAVIGREEMDRRTPEFSDQMNHMVVNPSWGVPRSITVKEYLPLLQRNPNAVSHLQVVDRNGKVISRGAVNFGAYSARSFPYALRQPPSNSNALGLVKFMFPNKYNIYLHDTPQKALFAHDKRAYSHGCIRLADPFDFAHVLLSAQSNAVEEEFNGYLKGGKESRVNFLRNVPVHLVYFTAYPEAKGRIGYRRDVYERDARLWAAMAEAGVALGAVSR